RWRAPITSRFWTPCSSRMACLRNARFGLSKTTRAINDKGHAATVGGINMALELRPNCECCDTDLPPASTQSIICLYECTFFATCADSVLHNVCPNCGGGFAPRPIRPATEWRPGLSVEKRPPSQKRVHLSRDLSEIAAHSQRIKDILPE